MTKRCLSQSLSAFDEPKSADTKAGYSGAAAESFVEEPFGFPFDGLADTNNKRTGSGLNELQTAWRNNGKTTIVLPLSAWGTSDFLNSD